MRLDGKDLNALARSTVRLEWPDGPREIQIEGFPFGFDVDEILPFPRPPVTGVRKKNGEVLRDSRGDPLLIHDEGDPDYRRERDRVFWLRMAALFYYAVSPCGQIEFNATGDPEKDPRTFFENISGEIKAAGISSDQVNGVVETARKLASFSDADAEETERAFFPTASGQTEG